MVKGRREKNDRKSKCMLPNTAVTVYNGKGKKTKEKVGKIGGNQKKQLSFQ